MPNGHRRFAVARNRPRTGRHAKRPMAGRDGGPNQSVVRLAVQSLQHSGETELVLEVMEVDFLAIDEQARRTGAGDSATARLDALGDVGADARVLRCGDDALEEPVNVSVLVALDLDFHGPRHFPSKNFDISNPEKLR